ncbi:unnamed protein product [Echinostoma caproni]|uniref:Uncharacterized protein n=1 Tax=Echinostoma caproni TaxID=27848 RepID=A0A183BGZ1_9TREM|nr:unnamed protein product [Echinostoma caproni]
MLVYKPLDKMRKKRHVASEIVARASSALPSFTDIFDEETFYIFFACLVILSFIIAFGLAWYFDIQIKDADAAGEKKRRRKLKR